MKCKNCGTSLAGSYCSNCGQKASTTRFTWSHIWYKLIDSVDIDRGFFHTIYYLLINPGKLIRTYIAGKRIGVYNPLKLSLIISAVTTIIVIETGTFGEGNPVELPFGINPDNIEDLYGYFKYSSKYFTFFSYTGVLIFIVFSWAFFRKLKYNFIEHFIANIYIMTGQWIILIILIPLFSVHEFFHSIYGPINIGYNIWGMAVFLKLKSIRQYLLITVASTLPLLISATYNYFLYRVVHEDFWLFLDRFFG